MKFYLAHAVLQRYDVRLLEHHFEATTGIQLINPFFDGEWQAFAEPLKEARTGYWSNYSDETVDQEVEGDLEQIAQADGLVIYTEKTVSHIGAYFEAWDAFRVQKKPVFIITSDWGGHPWIRYVARKSSGGIFQSFTEFENYCVEKFGEATKK